MILFPAIDIKEGKAVRLKQGKRDQADIFSDSPMAMAAHWAYLGASWLHIVDLDGAFDGASNNYGIIEEIASSLNIPVQVGGGIRTPEKARRYFDSGAARLIVGTVALENPAIFEEMANEWPGRIGVSIDAVKGRIKSRGWVRDTGQTVEDSLRRLSSAAFIIYTDIERDGMHTGINLDSLKSLLIKSEIPVIAAGGVSTLDDIKSVSAMRQYGKLEGIITGRALYEKTLDLRDALAWLEHSC